MRRNRRLSPKGFGLGLLLMAYLGLGIGPVVLARAPAQGQDGIVIHIFWGDGCPHCEEAKSFLLEELPKSYPEVEIQDHEVWYSPENAELFQEMAVELDFEPRGVPTIIVGERYWIGFNEQIGGEIETYVSEVSAELEQAQPAAGFTASTVLVILAAVLGAATLALLVHHKVLPRSSVRSGTETAPQPTKKRRRRRRPTSKGR